MTRTAQQIPLTSSVHLHVWDCGSQTLGLQSRSDTQKTLYNAFEVTTHSQLHCILSASNIFEEEVHIQSCGFVCPFLRWISTKKFSIAFITTTTTIILIIIIK